MKSKIVNKSGHTLPSYSTESATGMNVDTLVQTDRSAPVFGHIVKL